MIMVMVRWWFFDLLLGEEIWSIHNVTLRSSSSFFPPPLFFLWPRVPMSPPWQNTFFFFTLFSFTNWNFTTFTYSNWLFSTTNDLFNYWIFIMIIWLFHFLICRSSCSSSCSSSRFKVFDTYRFCVISFVFNPTLALISVKMRNDIFEMFTSKWFFVHDGLHIVFWQWTDHPSHKNMLCWPGLFESWIIFERKRSRTNPSRYN